MTQTARIGHNNSPTDKDLLLDYLKGIAAGLIDTADSLALEAEALPESLFDHSEAEELTNFVASLNDCTKSLEAMRKKEGEPHHSAWKNTNNFFAVYTDKLETAKKRANRPLTAWLVKQQELERERLVAEAERKRKEAEELAAAATTEEELTEAVATEKAAGEIQREVDSGKNLVASRGISGGTSLMTRWVGEIASKPDLDLEALRRYLPEEALQKAINAFVAAGNRELKGAKIYEKSTAVTRS